MKLICLNTWGGKLFDDLIEFVRNQATSTDIFCFQEILNSREIKSIARDCRSNLFIELERALPSFRGYFAQMEEGWDFERPVSFPLAIGQAAFVRDGLKVNSHRQVMIAEIGSKTPRSELNRPRGMQCLEIVASQGQPFHVFNLHGLLDDGHKQDTPARFAQFELVQRYLSETKSRNILCGDFNIYPNTQSIQPLEQNMRNLWREYGEPRTRNSNYADMEKYADYFGDFIFASPDIAVKNFTVLPDIVSDHMALVLDFS